MTHRVKRCMRVVIELEGIASIAIAFVHTVLLKEIGYDRGQFGRR